MKIAPRLACLAGFCLSVAANYPGFVSYDSLEQVLDARGGVYSDWHPPVMALFWHLAMKLLPGPVGMLVLGAALLWLGTYLVAVTWFRGTGRSTLWSLIPCLIVFFPPVFSISGAIWKDILMWAFLVLAIGISGTLGPSSQGSSSIIGVKLAIAAVLLLLAISVRHNAVFAAAPIAILCIGRVIGAQPFGWRIALGVGAALCLLLVILAGGLSDSLTTYRRNPWASVAIFDIAGTISRLHDRQEQEAWYMSMPERVRGPGSLDRVLTTYSPRYWLTMFSDQQPAFVCPAGAPSTVVHHMPFETCFQLAEEERGALRRSWESIIIRHPAAWLGHRLSVFRHVLGLDRAPSWDAVFIEPDTIYAQGYGVPRWLVDLQRGMKKQFERLAETWLYRPWIYLALNAGVFALCIWPRSQASREMGLIAASGLLYEASLFFMAPSADYRYSHYMIYISILVAALWLRAALLAPRRLPVDVQSATSFID
jgi:hypothetical protein